MNLEVRNKILIISLLIFIVFVNKTKGQVVKPAIQYVTIQDTFLIHVVDSLINVYKNNNNDFKDGYGYFMVSLSDQIRNGLEPEKGNRIDTVFEYNIHLSFMDPNIKVNKLFDLYPSYYSFVSDRIICFWQSENENILGLSSHSKMIFDKVINKYIIKRESQNNVFDLNSVRIFYLKDRFSDKYLKPLVLYKKVPISD
jgi:hypothetical protein